MEIDKIKEYLEKEIPQGFFLIVAPENKHSTLFAMMKFNPKARELLENLERMIKKYATWSSNGSFN